MKSFSDEFGLPAHWEELRQEIHLPSVEEKHAAESFKRALDDLLDRIVKHETSLGRSYVRLGMLLDEAQTKKHWLVLGYKSYGAFIDELGKKVGKQRTQMYLTLSVVQKLLPAVSEETLTEIGITKAAELQKVIKQGKTLTPDMIATALDPKNTVEDVRAEIFKTHNVQGEHPGTYRDLGGFYATADEWKEFQRAFDIAVRTDPVIPQDQPEWARKKEVYTRWAREYLATYEAEVERGL